MPNAIPLSAALVLIAWPAAAAECRPADLKPGAKGDRAAACRQEAIERSDGRPRAGSAPGFIDLGGGSEVRISGRARIEAEGRR